MFLGGFSADTAATAHAPGATQSPLTLARSPLGLSSPGYTLQPIRPCQGTPQAQGLGCVSPQRPRTQAYGVQLTLLSGGLSNQCVWRSSGFGCIAALTCVARSQRETAIESFWAESVPFGFGPSGRRSVFATLCTHDFLLGIGDGVNVLQALFRGSLGGSLEIHVSVGCRVAVVSMELREPGHEQRFTRNRRRVHLMHVFS